MKQNVDLTENRIFSHRTTMNNWLTDLSGSIIDLSDFTFGNILGEKVPWRVDIKVTNSMDEDDLGHQEKSLIALGNKSKRAEIKMYRNMDSREYCDRCGKRMNLIPWNKEVGVCAMCDKELSGDIDKCKWRTKDDIKNAIIRIA